MNEKRTSRDYKPEARSLIKRLQDLGFTIRSGDNGEERCKFDGNLDGFLRNLLACDEGHLYVSNRAGRKLTLFFVLGNSPGELICDYTDDAELDYALEAHYNAWEGRSQPTTEAP
jgi:hypothetical protein